MAPQGRNKRLAAITYEEAHNYRLNPVKPHRENSDEYVPDPK